jgi:putative ABC transport system permease protein
MFDNYLSPALYFILKNRLFSILNIIGLALGMMTSILLIKYVIFEFDYDKFHKNYNEIYRVTYKRYQDGQLLYHSAWSFAGIGNAMKSEIPEVEDFSRIFVWRGSISDGRMKSYDERFVYASSSLLKIFSFPLIMGDAEVALDEINTVLVSESAIKKHFGEEDPIEKFIMLNDKYIFKIVGVFKDVPENSHIKFDYIFSYKTAISIMGNALENDWRGNWVMNYILLKNGTNYKEIEIKLNKLIKKYRQDVNDNGGNIELILQPLGDIHLNSNLKDELEENGEKKIVIALLIIAILILVISWINYVNLSTIKSLKRVKEVGIKKVLGFSKYQLLKQFMFETFFLNSIAVIVAITLVVVMSPVFDNLIGKTIHLSEKELFLASSVFGGIFLAGIFFSGLYPAFFLSAFQPFQTLKGNFLHSLKNGFLRKALIIFQFFMTISILSAVYIIYNQLVFVKNHELGYEKQQIFVIKRPKTDNDSTYLYNIQAFKKDLLKYPIFKNVTTSKIVPGRENPYYSTGSVRRSNADLKDDRTFYFYSADHNFLSTYEIKILAGRDFSLDHIADNEAIIIDEASMKLLNFNSFDEALIEDIYVSGRKRKIIGIVKNFFQQSLNYEHCPTVIALNQPNDVRFFSAKINLENSKDVISISSQLWKEHFPKDPFEYFFLEDYFNEQYKHENRLMKVLTFFCILSLIISSLGIFGLSYFEMIKKVKEIGVRRVFGFSIYSIIIMISKTYILLIGISFLFSVPIVYFFISRWLNNFVIKINISVLFFLIPLMIVILVSFLTINYNIVKFSSINPCKSLKYE